MRNTEFKVVALTICSIIIFKTGEMIKSGIASMSRGLSSIDWEMIGSAILLVIYGLGLLITLIMVVSASVDKIRSWRKRRSVFSEKGFKITIEQEEQQVDGKVTKNTEVKLSRFKDLNYIDDE